MDFCQWNMEMVLQADPNNYEYTLNDRLKKGGKMYSFERLLQRYQKNHNKWDDLEGPVGDCWSGLLYNYALSSIRIYPGLARYVLKPGSGFELTAFETKSIHLAVARMEKAPLRVDQLQEEDFFVHQFAEKRRQAQAAREEAGTDIDISEEDLEELLNLPCRLNGVTLEHARP
jgi:hypothetical protein